jgi:hypothetical protein
LKAGIIWKNYRTLLYDILRDPYFSRLWVIQEFVLAREILTIIPDDRISWRHTVRAIAELDMYGELRLEEDMSHAGKVIDSRYTGLLQ